MCEHSNFEEFKGVIYMKILEPKSVHPDESTKKNVTDYFWEMFKIFQSGNESVSGNINGIQIIIFDDKN